MHEELTNLSHIVFGVELEFLLRREAESDKIPPGKIPIIIEQCLSEVESRGLSEVGICTLLLAILYPASGVLMLLKIESPVLPQRSTGSRMPTIGANTRSGKRQISTPSVIW